MEEEPVHGVPETDQKEEFFVNDEQPQVKAESKKEAAPEKQPEPQQEPDEFDLSDITATPKELTREEIIAAAEEAAFAEAAETVS